MKTQKTTKRHHFNELSDKWKSVYKQLPKHKRNDSVIQCMFFLNDRGVEPDGVTDEDINAFITHLITCKHADPFVVARAFLRYWLSLSDVIEGKLPQLTPMPSATEMKAARRQRIVAPLKDDIEKFLGEKKRANPQIEAQSLKSNENDLHLAAELLADAGAAPTSIDDLITTQAINILADHPHFGGEASASRSRESIFGLLAALAKFLGNPDRAEAIRTVKNIELPKATPAIGFDMLLAISPFDDLSELGRALSTCAVAIRALRKCKKRKTALPLAQDSLAFVMVVQTFKMPIDMIGLRFGGPERKTPFGDRPTLIDERVDSEECGDGAVKAAISFEALLKPNAVGLVDDYYFSAQLKLRRDPDWLFEKLMGGRRDRSTIGRGVRAVADSLGHPLCWTMVREIGVKTAAKRGHGAEALTGAVGYTLSKNFKRRYAALLDADASEKFVAALFDEDVGADEDSDDE